MSVTGQMWIGIKNHVVLHFDICSVSCLLKITFHCVIKTDCVLSTYSSMHAFCDSVLSCINLYFSAVVSEEVRSNISSRDKLDSITYFLPSFLCNSVDFYHLTQIHSFSANKYLQCCNVGWILISISGVLFSLLEIKT